MRYGIAVSSPTNDNHDPLDDCEWPPARDLFRRLGYEPLPPAVLDDFQLPGRLWEFIYAMAGRRIYLCHTDHVSDPDLYAWLHDEWLEQELADSPSEPEENPYVDMTDFGNGLDPIIWLRYFATEEQALAFAAEHNLPSIPAHEDPPWDRDRWLPMPPGVSEESDDEDPEESPDPLGLQKVDEAIHAEKQEEEMAAFTGGEPPEGWQRPVDQLRQTGITLLPPDELTDETVTAKLWELLHNLACRGFYVLNTDHLSDRELYAGLWHHGLREEALLPGRSRTGGWFHDFIGSGSEEDIELWLRYYATEEERAEHAKEWPEAPLPPRVKPPHNRDWRLPKGPF
jgi:hypothetical protein